MQFVLAFVCSFACFSLLSAQSPETDAAPPPSSSVLAQQNKALVIRYYEEAWRQRNFDFADSAFAPDYVRHDNSNAVEGPGEAPLQSKVTRDKMQHLSDLRMNYEVLIADGDMVAVRWTSRAEPRGLASVIRTVVGKRGPIESTGANFFRIRDGRVVELWNNRDDLTVFREAGVFRLYVVGGVALGIAIALAGMWGTRWWSRRSSQPPRERIVD